MLATARVPVQVDIGFGDAVESQAGLFPTLLNLPAPWLRLYPRETVIAEKVHAMVVLGLLNGRLKDFYDIWYLSRVGSFSGSSLATALERTFEARMTPMPRELPSALTQRFLAVPGKPQMWTAFARKAALPASTPSLDAIQKDIEIFIWPVLSTGKSFDANWAPSGPWSGDSFILT
jgi:hypothetical protein